MPSQKDEINGFLANVAVGDYSTPKIMGVINLTSNSFYKQSVRLGADKILSTALKMEKEGADFIDLGARSTAPYRTSEISEEREAELLSFAVKTLSGKVKVPISIDTTRVLAARQALDEGASILNDPYGLAHQQGEKLAHLVSQREVSIIITAHEISQGEIHNPVLRVRNALVHSLKLAEKCGISSKQLTIDPGIGFFSDSRISSVEWNTSIIANLLAFRKLRKPMLVGVSRKRFLGILGGNIPVDERLPASLAAAAIAVCNGAHVIRTHDVKETRQTIAVASKIKQQAAKGLSQNC